MTPRYLDADGLGVLILSVIGPGTRFVLNRTMDGHFTHHTPLGYIVFVDNKRADAPPRLVDLRTVTRVEFANKTYCKPRAFKVTPTSPAFKG